MIIVNDVSTSKLINVDKDTGSVLESFQLTNIQSGFNIKAYLIYTISLDEFLISVDGSYTANKIGISANSQSDALLLKLNLTSQTIVQSSVWDCQNRNELVNSVEFDGDIIYQFGQLNNNYLFI